MGKAVRVMIVVFCLLSASILSFAEEEQHQQENDQPLEVKQQTSTAISLQSVTDDIVKQLMPELEQQLRLLLEQALKEKLPEDIKQTEIPSASNPDN